GVADCDGGGAGQRRKVDEVCRVVAKRVRQRVGQDKTAFGVGVDDLDGLAVGADHHVTGALSRGTWHVLCRRDYCHHVERQLARGNHVDGRQRGGGTGHVVLHPAHLVRLLERDASAV